MKIVKLRAYAGPNVIAPFAVVHLCFAVTGSPHWPGNAAGRACSNRLLALLPGLTGHPDSSNHAGGFAAELQRAESLPLSYVVARVATEIQRREGAEPHLAEICQPAKEGFQEVFYRYDEPDVATLAGQLATDLVLTLLPAETRPENARTSGRDAETILAIARQRIEVLALDQTARALIEEASRRDIPWFILNRSRRIVQLGQGRHLRRIRETVTSTTSAISTWLQADKSATNQLLGGLHFPVPRQAVVRDSEAAVRAAKEIRFPVVVKPLDAKKGMGISLHLENEEAVRNAFTKARRYRNLVIVEGHIAGDDHRALVVNGQLIAVAKRIPGAVVGDGQRNIAQLVEALNHDPRRGVGFSRLMNRIELDAQAEAMLRQRGYSRETVPPQDEVVYLRATANISTGGTAIDMTDQVHPENRWMLERAARVSGLDVVGIDFITPDIARSYREVGGAICEINSSPGLRPHQVAEGEPRDVVGPIVDMLFPEKRDGRIPIAAVTGTNGKTTTSRMLAQILRVAGGEIGANVIGLVTTEGVYIQDDLIAKGDFAGSTGARVLLRDPSVEAAVLETARGGIIKGGLAFDYCDVGAVLNVTTDHIGVDGIESLDEMAMVKGLVIEAAKRLAVLNAEDPRCLAMAQMKRPDQVCLFTAGDLTDSLRDHLAKGGKVICVDEDGDGRPIVLHGPEGSETILPADKIPATLGGAARHNILNAQAAIGLAYGLGIPGNRIAEGLLEFNSAFDNNPGRLNVFDGHPFKVLMDFAHNPDGVKTICDTARRMKITGRRICVLGTTGHRQEEHIGEVCGIVAPRFDSFICTRNKRISEKFQDLRGYPGEEIPQRLAAALMENGVDGSRIVTIDDDNEAVDKGLSMARKGDLLVLLLNNKEWAWPRILSFQVAAPS